MPWTREQKRRTSQLYREPVERKVDEFLSTVGSLLTAISQRRMTDEQMDRCARILQEAERDLLRRIAAPARNSSTRQRSVTRARRKAA